MLNTNPCEILWAPSTLHRRTKRKLAHNGAETLMLCMNGAIEIARTGKCVGWQIRLIPLRGSQARILFFAE